MNFPDWTRPIQDALNRGAENKLIAVSVPTTALAILFEQWYAERQAAETLKAERELHAATKDRSLAEARELRATIDRARAILGD